MIGFINKCIFILNLSLARFSDCLSKGNTLRFPFLHIRVVMRGDCCYQKELNLIRWNDKEPKYDIRDWDEGHGKMDNGDEN